MKPDIARWVAFIIGVAIGLLVHRANATERVQVPAASARYRLAVEHAAGERFGLDAPVARLAAQLHQESGWNPRAASPYAQGLAQFTPPTAAWLPRICPDIGQPDPWDAQWSTNLTGYLDNLQQQDLPGTVMTASSSIVDAIRDLGRDLLSAITGAPLVDPGPAAPVSVGTSTPEQLALLQQINDKLAQLNATTFKVATSTGKTASNTSSSALRTVASTTR